MNSNKKPRFQLDRLYEAEYIIPTRFNEQGKVIASSRIITSFSGKTLRRYGLKATIQYNAKRLQLPKLFHCTVKTEEDEPETEV